MSSLDSTVEDQASNDDREWFHCRPERQYRLRLRLPRELAAEQSTHVLVIQFCRGVRYRQPVWFNGGSLPFDDDCELGRVAELIHDKQPVFIIDGHVFSLEDLPVEGAKQ